MLTVPCFKRILRMYRALKGALDRKLKLKEEKNRDGTVRTITEKMENGGKNELNTQSLHLITTVLILLPFLLYNFVCVSPVYVHVQT